MKKAVSLLCILEEQRNKKEKLINYNYSTDKRFVYRYKTNQDIIGHINKSKRQNREDR